MATTPHTHTDLYTCIHLGGVQSPGTVKLSGFARKHDWEIQNPKGHKGEHTNNKGPKNGGFTATFYLADLADVAAWDEFQRLIESTVEGPKARALSAYHPDLVRHKIVDVVLEELGDFVHDGKNGATIAVKFIEHRPPKPKPVARPDAGKVRRGVTTVNDPNAAAKAELAALREQARAP